MPPPWPVVRLLEGRVSVTTCLAVLLILGAVGIAVAGAGHPLLGLLLAFSAESVCCAASKTSKRVYRAPRLVERLCESSRILEYMVFIVYYTSKGRFDVSSVVAVAFILLHIGVVDADEKMDGIVAALMLLAAGILEIHNMIDSLVLLALGMLPLLLATGLATATLIYREATGGGIG
ncbi:hypothetical protein Pyrfu_1697 [Pyrolobus fumarii 1A]|uniref:Uncharacterized protein n=1 Tax=Pyrolobus fumarii (strain DSM 11204 / 1A) TaxID=694429 RepID=G0ECI3_PYRF1|nr:hypothetical protein [Pyrolobus fumarii]AEM39553.1 hypothetical protein Pyrfu_1697 [Pyrolobus fumarii 1A]